MKPVLLPFAERLARQALRQRGAVSRSVPSPLGALHTYDLAGSGALPTTVFLHGLGSAATPFAPVFARMTRRVRRVIAPDYPGHGFSAPPTEPLTPTRLFEAVAAALDAVLDEPAVVVGNSLGGALALQYALARPERVRALVLLSPAGARSTDEEWGAIRGAFDIATRADAQAFCRRVYHRTPWFLPLVAHELADAIGRPAVRDLLEAASNAETPEPAALATLPMPILLSWGRSERLLPEAHFDYFRQHLPGHAVIERPVGVGHCPHFDAPAALAERILAFAAQADAPAPAPVTAPGG